MAVNAAARTPRACAAGSDSRQRCENWPPDRVSVWPGAAVAQRFRLFVVPLQISPACGSGNERGGGKCCMPDLILNAPALDRLRKPPRIRGMKKSAVLKDAIRRLGGSATKPENRLLQVALDMGLYADATEAEHFKQHWLNDPPGSGFWPTIDTEPILRKGLWLACKKFKTSGLPCEYFWVISGDQNSSLGDERRRRARSPSCCTRRSSPASCRPWPRRRCGSCGSRAAWWCLGRCSCHRRERRRTADSHLTSPRSAAATIGNQ